MTMTDSTESGPSDDAAVVAARQRAGRAIRDIGHAFVGRHATIDQIEHLADVLEGIGEELWPLAERSRDPANFRGSGSDPVEYPQGRFHHDFDDRPVSGRSSPWGLDLELHRHGDEIEAFVTLRAAHEGAPNRSHGGVVAALFDDVFGFILGVLRQPGFTGDLYVRYEAPTPLFRRLSCRVRLDRRDGRKLLVVGELTDAESGQLLATAKATFIAIDAELFVQQTAARPAPPDEDA